MKKSLLEEIKTLKALQPSEAPNQSTLPPTQISKSALLASKRTPFPSQVAPSSAPHNPFLFQGKSFCFPIIDVELTSKRIACLSSTILAHGGKVIAPGNIEVQYVLCNPMMKIQYMREKIEPQIKYERIINFKFVLDSVKEGELQRVQSYHLYAREGDTSQITLSIHDKIRKSISEQMGHLQPARERSQAYARQELAQETQLKSSILKKGSFPLNEFISGELMKLQKIYEHEKDIGRKIAYLKAVSVVRSQTEELTVSTVDNLKGIGKKIAEKIKEIIQTGKLKKLQKMGMSEERMACEELCKVWGIGPSKALELYELGIKSHEELRASKLACLNKNQKLGLKYFEDFQKKIPRQKVTQMFQFVKDVFKDMVRDIQLYKFEVCGSYRRQKQSCGDMDIIISRKDGIYEKSLLLDLVLELEKRGFLTDSLTFPKVGTDRKSLSYMGVCRHFDPTHHRIDIKYYPIEQYAFAVLYFTGSGMFNRAMRLHATKIGLQLSDHGVIARTAKQGKTWRQDIPVCLTEKDIFQLLSMDYKEPHERDM